MSAPASTLAYANVVALEGVVFRWPRQRSPVLDIANWTLAAGEHAFLYGPSGGGKSTLLGLVGGVLKPQTGRVILLGDDLSRMSSATRDRMRVDHIGFIFQQFNLVPYLSIIDNVVLPCRFSSRRKKRALSSGSRNIHEEAQRLLQHLDLAPPLWRKPVAQLSVGQQQRVAAARALIGRPELLIADEPTSALDALRQQAFLDLLLRECEQAGSTLLFVSHDQRLAERFPRQLALAEFNRALAEGQEDLPA